MNPPEDIGSRVQELFRLRERQAQMLDALLVFLQGDDIGDGCFLAIILRTGQLEFTRMAGLLRVRVVNE